MKKIAVLLLVVVLVTSGFIVLNSGDKCTGRVYQDHPGLLAECMHNQTVSHGLSKPYPEPTPCYQLYWLGGHCP